jgi:hypothetical protein
VNDGIERANKAKAVLESPAYCDAYKAVREKLHSRLEVCPDAEVDALRKCLWALNAVQQHMAVAMNSGRLDQFNLDQQKKRAASPLRRVFGRG